MHGFVGIRAKKWEIVLRSPFHKTIGVGMIDDSIDNKIKPENSKWQKTVMNSVKEHTKQVSQYRFALRDSIKFKTFRSNMANQVH
jgi:hypothetical protein